MNMKRVLVALALVILIALLALPTLADTILTFDMLVHNRPVRITVRQVTTNDDSADSTGGIVWICEVQELDDAPSTPEPTSEPTSTVQPTVQPTGQPTIRPTSQPTGQPTSQPGHYVASKSGTKFHIPSCRYAASILPANLITFTSRQEALDAGYAPCSVCKP